MSARRKGSAPLDVLVVAHYYTRVSSDEQADEGLSHAQQPERCVEYIGRQGNCIVGEHFSDVLSGRKDSRNDYQRMLRTIRGMALEGKPQMLVVPAFDRLGRNLEERVRAYKELQELDVPLHGIRENGIVPEFVYNILASVAQEESRQIAVRVREVNDGLADKGWHRPGRTPWGYQWRPATDAERGLGAPKSVLERHPDEASYVEDAWDRLARGTSLKELARWAAALPSVARGDRNLNFGVLRTTFRAPVYVGRHGNGDDVDSVLERPVGRWPALVTDDVWLQVRASVDKGKRKLPSQASGKYLLTGFLRCDRCGSRMAGNTIKTKRKKSGICRTYVCTGYALGARREGTCRSRSVSADTLEDLVLRRVTTMLAIATDPKVIDAVRAAWDEEKRRYLADPSVEQIAALDRDIVKARERMRKNHTLFIDGVITREAYGETQPGYQRDIETAETKRAELTGRVARAALPPVYVVLESLKGWYRALQDARAVDPYAARAALAELLDTVMPVPLEKFGRYEVRPSWTRMGKLLLETAALHGAAANLSSVEMFGTSNLSTLDTSAAA